MWSGSHLASLFERLRPNVVMPLGLCTQTTERDRLLSLSKASIYTYSLKLNFHTKVPQSLTKFSQIFSL